MTRVGAGEFADRGRPSWDWKCESMFAPVVLPFQITLVLSLAVLALVSLEPDISLDSRSRHGI